MARQTFYDSGRNFHRFTFYWHWRVGRFSFMIWYQAGRGLAYRRHWYGDFTRRSDGGWVLRLPLDVSLMMEGPCGET